jgi:hypothetical protein
MKQESYKRHLLVFINICTVRKLQNASLETYHYDNLTNPDTREYPKVSGTALCY